MDPNKRKSIFCKNILDPDPELLVWEKWIKIRKEETEHLARKTRRTPAELAMNLLENIREQKERKLVLENSQIKRKVGVRNAIWEQPQRLKQKNYSEPVYELQRTRVELGRPRVIEHVGVPRHIQEKEKGIAGVSKRKPCTKLDSMYVNYREKREKELEIEIKKIDPFRPQIDEIIVIGNKPKPPQKKLPPLPIITVTSNFEIEEDICTIYAIRINNTIFFKEVIGQKLCHIIKMQKEPWHEACESWSYYFNCPVNKVGRSKIFLQNLGTMTLRYYWKKNKLAYEDTEDNQVFFFNKNENVIFPGQSQEISVTFISSAPGSFSESWEIKLLNICFFDDITKQLIINLHADSVENIAKIKKKINKLENIIYNNVLKNLARDLLEEIVVKATSVVPQIYPYKKMFLEAEMFVMKNPVCFYHQTEVMKLKEMFAEMAPEKSWDLSFTSWRLVMMEKEFDDRMKYYENLRNSHRECLKPWYEDDDLLAQKYRVIKQLLGQMADTFDEEFATVSRMLHVNDQSQEKLVTDMAIQEETNTISLLGARNIFYLKAYEHVATTIELCAGFLSGLDLNRWINFDFCRT